MPERVPHSLGGTEHVSRLLVEKRCDVYSQVAALVMEVEERFVSLFREGGMEQLHLKPLSRRASER